MLCDPQWAHTPEQYEFYNVPMPERVQEGVYLIGSFNFEFHIGNGRQDRKVMYPEFQRPPGFKSFNCYGVCDSPDQLLADFGVMLQADSRRLCVALTCIRKSGQSEEGWHWHKWGPYIGRQEPTWEYLFDEPMIEEVYVYHVYNLDGYLSG